MRLLIGITAAWIFAAALTGGLGSFLLQRSWYQREEESFRRDVGAATAIVRATVWDEPWENDPAWSEMELQLDLDIVPVYRDLGGRPLEREFAIQWSSTAGGRRRLSAVLPFGPEPSRHKIREHSQDSGGGKLALQLTREVEKHALAGTWWVCWAVVNVCGLVFAAVAMYVRWREAKHQQVLLTPWLDSVRSVPTGDGEFLPPIADSTSDLELPLSIVAESINQIVADLKNANDRNDLVLRNLREGVLAVDDRSRVLLANKALRRLLELPDEAYLYRPLLEIVRVPAVGQLVEHVLKEHSSREETLEFGGQERSLRILARPMPLGEERFGVLITVRDETLIKRIESVRRDFVANASHELKTPLAAIRAYAETLQLGALDDREAAERFVGNIVTQADRINGLVQGMLQLSRVQSGSALKIESFDAREAVEPCVAAAGAMARSKGVKVQAEMPAEPMVIRSDRDGFQTIASNLLSNAVRYTEDGGTVSVLLSSEADWCVFQVQDTGVGIQEKDLERIFERFYRAEKDRSTDTGGTGLGLSIVKHLVQGLGGGVTATSEPGRGSCFEVRLPRFGS